MVHRIRWKVLGAVVALTLACALLALAQRTWLWGLLVLVPLLLVGLWDITQTRHSVLRNHPILGHLRFLLEDLGPEMHQYFVESNTQGRPFDRDERSLAYERAKGTLDEKPFGTEIDVYAPGFLWINHSIAARQPPADAPRALRVAVGGARCTAAYSASLLNISAMSFGALGARAIRALSEGARLGGFAHDTGEGGLSRYHREGGGDLIWEIGTGYFGCRRPDGGFDPDQREARLKVIRVRRVLERPGLQEKRLLGGGARRLLLRLLQLLVGGGLLAAGQDLVEIEPRLSAEPLYRLVFGFRCRARLAILCRLALGRRRASVLERARHLVDVPRRRERDTQPQHEADQDPDEKRADAAAGFRLGTFVILGHAGILPTSFPVRTRRSGRARWQAPAAPRTPAQAASASRRLRPPAGALRCSSCGSLRRGPSGRTR